MMKLMTLALALVSLVACSKDEETYTVVYKVEVDEPRDATLEVSYTDTNGKTTTLTDEVAKGFTRRVSGLKTGTSLQFSGFLKAGYVHTLKGEAELEVFDSKGNKVWEDDKSFDFSDHTVANQLGFQPSEVKEKTKFDIKYVLR